MITFDLPMIASVILLFMGVGGLVMTVQQDDNSAILFQIFRFVLFVAVGLRVFGVW